MKNKTVVIVIALAVLIFGAKFGYDKLKNADIASQGINSSPKAETKKNEGAEKSGATETEGKEGEDGAKAEVVKAPEFTVRDIDGNHVKFSSFVGKPVVINFWATWCKYCRQEMPDLQEVYDEYKSKGVEFVLINATDNQNETRETVMEYLEKNNITMPVYFDEGIVGIDGLTINDSAQAVYGVPSYPSTVFIDKDGNIAGAKLGLITKEQLVSAIEKII